VKPILPSLKSHRPSAASHIALSYSAFLFVSLVLLLVLCLSSIHTNQEFFWEQEAAKLEVGAATVHSYRSAATTYANQLLTDGSLVRLSSMDGSDQTDFVFTAWQVMQELSSRNYGLLNLPVRASYIYLEKSGYVISSSQFTEAEQFYRAYRSFKKGSYERWISMLKGATSTGAFADASPYTGVEGDMFYVCRINRTSYPTVNATVWFELDMGAVRELFLPQGVEDAVAFIYDDTGMLQLGLGQTQAWAPSVSFDQKGMANVQNVRAIRRTDAGGWTYILALPRRLCTEAVGTLDGVMIAVFVLSLIVGAVVVILLIRRSVKPIHQLTSQLTQARDDNAELQRQIDAQRPALTISYLRTLISGHVSTSEEFAYMMRYLNLEGDYRYYVLFCVAHRQDNAPEDPLAEYETLTEHIDEYLTGRLPLYYYTTLDRSFVVLTAYDSSVADPVMDLQQRVMELHDDLAANHSLWFYAGVGACATQPQHLWESYEQARTAARYTAKNYIFLPYEFIRKDADSWYYPIEISAKLLHFITTGNQQQVTEMFALIYRENMEQRSLSVPLLSLLLSDLRNTLFKARFQVPDQKSDEAASALRVLDERLHQPPTFPLLEMCARTLCEFFTQAAEPSDPIPEIVRYLEENFTDPSLCLSKLGDMFHISESYLSHLFKSRTGQNFSVYLENLRLTEAARRLKDKSCSLSNLYVELGYTNPTTLRRAFKKHFGITPSEMRQQG